VIRKGKEMKELGINIKKEEISDAIDLRFS